MPVSSGEGKREPITTAAQLWKVLGNHVSTGAREFQRGDSSKRNYVAVGQAMLWSEMSWVIVHDDLHQDSRGALDLALKWRSVSDDNPIVIPDSITMRNGRIITPNPGLQTVQRADYVLDNTHFGSLEPHIENGVAALWGFASVE